MTSPTTEYLLCLCSVHLHLLLITTVIFRGVKQCLTGVFIHTSWWVGMLSTTLCIYWAFLSLLWVNLCQGPLSSFGCISENLNLDFLKLWVKCHLQVFFHFIFKNNYNIIQVEKVFFSLSLYHLSLPLVWMCTHLLVRLGRHSRTTLHMSLHCSGWLNNSYPNRSWVYRKYKPCPIELYTSMLTT